MEFHFYFLGTENKENELKNKTSKETEDASQHGHAVTEDLKQQENLDDSFVRESSVLETSVGKNSVVSGMSTNWCFVLVVVKFYWK